MIAGIYNLTIEQGVTLNRVLTWTDSNDALVDLTNYTARAQVRDSKSGSTKIVDLTTENGGISLGGAAGTITLTMTDTATAALSALTDGRWDLELISSGGTVTRLVEGKCTISLEVTR